MEIKVKGKIGESVFEITHDAKDPLEAFAEVAFIGENHSCGLCKSKEVSINVRKVKGKGDKEGQTFTYLSRKCSKCGAASTLGKYNTGGYFWKQWEIYKPNFNE